MSEIAPNEHLYSIVVGFIGGVIGLLGLLANCLSLPVLMRREMRTSNSTLCLIMLGIYDLLLLVIDFFTTSLDWAIFGLNPDALFLYKFTMPASVVCDPLIMILVSASVYTTVILSMDRCMAVLRPLHWTSTFTRKRIKTALVVVFIFALILVAPMYFEAELHMVYYPKFNDTFIGGKPTKYYFSWFHQEIYIKQIIPVFQIIIPLILIVCSNTAIIAKVVVHKRKSSILRGRVKIQQHFSPATSLNPRDSQCKLNSRSLHKDFENRKRVNQLSEQREAESKIETVTEKVSEMSFMSTTDTRINDKSSNVHTTPTTGTFTKRIASKNLERKEHEIPKKSYGVHLGKLTTQVVAISLITLISRSMAAANFYIVADENIFYVKYCSRVCGWTGALNLLLIKINSSINFVFYCFFGGKFRAVFKSTFRCFWRSH